jgi:hypothetical protein
VRLPSSASTYTLFGIESIFIVWQRKMALEFKLEHHRIFDIPELLTEIFEYITTPGPDSSLWRVPGAQDLLRAALCCKTFSGPALDVLWEKLRSELPLFALLPGFQEKDGVWVGTTSSCLTIMADHLQIIIRRLCPNQSHSTISTGSGSIHMPDASEN